MESTLQAKTLRAITTGSTCGDMCWHAREEICRCSCGGANHGILNNGGNAPKRTCKIDGNFYELAAIIPGPSSEECWADAFRRAQSEQNAISRERFPGLDSYAYGDYRPEKTMPIVDRKISATQAKWPEVAAIPGACRLIWARPAGTRYLVRGPDYKSVYNDQQQKAA